MKLLTVASIIIFAVILRLIPHPPNFAPIGALAIFGGAYLDRKYALIALIAMFASDIFLGFHSTMGFVYLSFLLSVFIGIWIGRNKSAPRIFLGAVSSSILFFFITNFGVWVATPLYEKTLSGLSQAFFMAIPFFRNTVLSDLFYLSLFIFAYQTVLGLISVKRLRPGYENIHKNRG